MNHNKLQRVVIKKNNIIDAEKAFDKMSVRRVEADLQNCSNATMMFMDCTKLQEVVLTNTDNIAFASKMFSGCTSLQAAPEINTASIEDASLMFEACSSLERVPVYDFSSIVNADEMFAYCTSLSTLPPINFSALASCQYGLGRLPSLKRVRLQNYGKPDQYFAHNFRGSRVTAAELNRFFEEDLVDVIVSYPDIKAYIYVNDTPAATDPTLNVQIACQKGWIVEGALTGCNFNTGGHDEVLS